jgi:flagellar hook-associated protein 3 FlgL
MRITEQSKFLALQRQLQKRSSDVQTATEQIASGRRIQSREQDAVASASIDRMRRVDAEWNGFADVGRIVRSEAVAADTALGSAEDIVSDARNLAIQVGSGPRTASQLEAAANEVGQLFESLRSVANTEHRGQHLFGGTDGATEPFDAAGQFRGSTKLRSVEIQPGDEVRQPDGATAFGANGGVDIFQALSDLESALRAGDQGAARTLGDTLRDGISQLTRERQAMGSHLDALDQAEAFRENVQLQLEVDDGELGDTDIADAASRLQMAQATLQATVEVNSRLKSMDLLGKL